MLSPYVRCAKVPTYSSPLLGPKLPLPLDKSSRHTPTYLSPLTVTFLPNPSRKLFRNSPTYRRSESSNSPQQSLKSAVLQFGPKDSLAEGLAGGQIGKLFGLLLCCSTAKA